MKHIAEFDISLQPIQESSWLARALSFKSARESDHYRWLEEINYFNQVITYIFHANYTERDFSSDIKTILEPLLRQYSIDSATIKVVLEGQQSLSDIKKKLFSILDPYYASKTFYPIFERLSELHNVIVSHKERDKFNEDEVSLAEEDDAIAQYKLISNASLTALRHTLKHHDNQNLLDISRVLLSQLSKSLERTVAIAYSKRPFWFLRWLFPKREAQYQQRMMQINARRDSLEELFTAGTEGMAELIIPGSTSQETAESLTVNVEANDVTALLIDFLAEILTHTHVDRVVYTKVEFQELTETVVRAKVSGVKVESFDEDVKAVTYHEAEVVQGEDGVWETVVVFDI